MVVGPRAATRFPSFLTASKNLIKRLDKLICVCIRERHRWTNLDYVVKWAFRSHQYAAFAHLIDNVASFVREFDAEEKTGTADFADHFVTRIEFVKHRE